MLNKKWIITILLTVVGFVVVNAEDFVRFEDVTLSNGRQVSYVVTNNPVHLEDLIRANFGIDIRFAGRSWNTLQERDLDRVFAAMMRNNFPRFNFNSITAMNIFMPDEWTKEIFAINAVRQSDGSIVWRDTSWRFTK